MPLNVAFPLAVDIEVKAVGSGPVVVLSSLRMVPVAAAVPMAVPALGLDRVTVKFSADSTVLSPATLTVMVFVASPAAKLTVPVGNTPPAKSAAAAGLAPLPVTAKAAVDAPPCCRCASR